MKKRIPPRRSGIFMETAMNNRIPNLLGLLGVMLILFSAAANAQHALRLDRLAPYDAAYFAEWDDSRLPRNAFPNHDAAMALWWESLDDVLEVRLFKEEVNAHWNQIASNEEWSAVWGERRALTITGFGDNLTKIPAFLYAIETRNSQLAERFITTIFEHITQIIPMAIVEEEMFRGYVFTSLYLPGRLPGLSLSLLVEDEWLYLSSSKPMLIDAMERLEFDDPGLDSHPLYQDAREHLPGELISFQFYNFEEMVMTLDDIVTSFKAAQPMMSQDNESLPVEEAIGLADKILDCLRIARSHAIAMHTDERGHDHTRAFTRFASEYADPALMDILSREPALARWEKYLPRETGSYSTGNVFGLPDLWSILHSLIPLLPNSSDIEDQLARWQKEFGFDVERDVIAWMGDAWAILRPVIELDAVVPFNRTAAFIEVKDRDTAQRSLTVVEKVINDLLKQSNIPITIETSNHRGVEITTVRPALPVLPLSPSWTLHEDALIITSDSALMRQMLDAAQRGRGGIDRNRYYRELSEVFAQPFSKAAFQDVEADFYAQREAVRRIAALHDANDQLRNSITALLLDRAAYLLSVKQVFKASAKRSIIQDDAMMSEKTILKQDLRTIPSTRNMLRGRFTLGFEPFIAQDASAALQKGDLERAARLYSILTDHRSDHADYIDGLAKTHQRAGRIQDALTVYDKAIATNPSVRLLANRESIRPGAEPEVILNNILSVAQMHPVIRVDAALFATAIALRNSNSEHAQQLLGRLLENYPDSALSEAAHQEIQRLKGEISDGMDVTVHPLSRPPLRGDLPDEFVWFALPAYEIQEDALYLTAAKDADTLYLLLHPPEGAEKNMILESESIRVQLNPSRDYVHFHEIYAEREQINGDRKTGVPIQRITRGPAALVGASAPPETQIPFLDLASILQELVKDVPEADQLNFELPWKAIQPNENYHASVIFSGVGKRWLVLVQIPLQGLKNADQPFANVWNVHLEYQVVSDGDRHQWSLEPAGLRMEIGGGR